MKLPWSKKESNQLVGNTAKDIMKGAISKQGRAITGRLGSPGYNDVPQGYVSHEFMAELLPPGGLNKFLRMVMNDPIVGGLMLHLCFAMKRIKWEIVGDNADFVKNQIENLATPLDNIFLEMASAFIFGFYIGEMIWTIKNGLVTLYDIEPRFQTSIQSINDKDGMIEQFSADVGTVKIPYKKCLHHVFLSYSRNPWGIALVRHIYKPYYYKVSIEATEAVGLDRDLTGLPMMTSPPGFDFTAADPGSPNFQELAATTLSWATEIVTNVRKDQQQGIVKPDGWVFDIIRGENRTTIPTTDIISRYNTEMAAGLLENFLALGAFATTNNSNTSTHVNNFIAACEAYASAIANSLTYQVFKKICEYNGKDKFPWLSTRITNFSTLKDTANYIKSLTDSGVIMPNQKLEKAVLDLANLPENDDEIGWDEDGKPKAPPKALPKKVIQGGQDNAQRD
jgi:hypothetical protein